MLVILAFLVHLVVQVRWVISVHQVLHFQVNGEKRVFQALSVSDNDVLFERFHLITCYSIIGIPGQQGLPGSKGEPGTNPLDNDSVIVSKLIFLF